MAWKAAHPVSVAVSRWGSLVSLSLLRYSSQEPRLDHRARSHEEVAVTSSEELPDKQKVQRKQKRDEKAVLGGQS